MQCQDLKRQIVFVPARLLAWPKLWDCEDRVVGTGVDSVGLRSVKGRSQRRRARV